MAKLFEAGFIKKLGNNSIITGISNTIKNISNLNGETNNRKRKHNLSIDVRDELMNDINNSTTPNPRKRSSTGISPMIANQNR